MGLPGSVMRTSVGGMVAAILMCLVLPTDLDAQTDQRAADVATSLAICKGDETEADDEENEFQPCEQYIDANIENSGDTIKWIIEEIDNRKHHAQQVTSTYLARDEIRAAGRPVLLSLMTAISTAVAKGYPKLSIRGIYFARRPHRVIINDCCGHLNHRLLSVCLSQTADLART